MFLLFLCSVSFGAYGSKDINLLMLVPWPDSRKFSGYGPGPSLYGGARVAVSDINNSSDILPDYRINMIESRHEACGLVEASEGVVNFMKYAFNPNSPETVAAVIGLYCSTSTRAISRIAGHSGVDLLQLTAANSPSFLTDTPPYSHLWYFLQHATNYASMMIEIMDLYGWQKVGYVHDIDNTFILGVAEAFLDAIDNSEKEIRYLGRIIQDEQSAFQDIIESIRTSGIFVIFVHMSSAQEARLFCRIAQRGMVWPNYAWIVIDNKAQFIIDDTEDIDRGCSLDTLKEGLNGSITSLFNLRPDDMNATLVSNYTYQQYVDKYEDELEAIRDEYYPINVTARDDNVLYSAVAYDQVWAFALAVHAALPELSENNISIETYGYGQPRVTAILERYLSDINFQGASGTIKFNSDTQSVLSSIRISQVSDGSDVRVGLYDANNLDSFSLSINDPPPDSVVPSTVVVPIELSIVMFVVIFIMIVLVSVNLVLMLHFRKHSEIKAISPFLSCLIVFGCYCECFSSLLLIVQVTVKDPSIMSFSVLCHFVQFLGLIGIYLILSTVLLRLVRIFRIFNLPSNKIGKIWKDQSLSLIVLAITNYVTVIFIIWISVDTLMYETEIEYNTDVFPVVAYTIGRCSCRYLPVWLILLYGVVVLFLLALIFFAIQTRTINKKAFKDTKKVNLFSFLLTIVGLSLYIVYQIFMQLKVYHYAYFTLSIAYLSMCFISQCVYFMPKIYPVLLDKCITHSNTV